MEGDGRWAGLALLLLLATALTAVASADYIDLVCAPSTTVGVWKICSASGAVDGKQNITYALTIPEEDAHNQRFDLNITLSPVTGDSDLLVIYPQGTFVNGTHSDIMTSARNIGDDIIFIGRSDVPAGQLLFSVVGYSVHSKFDLTVEMVTAQRELRPMAEIALGQFFLECCKMNGSCSQLRTDERLQDDTPDTNPNYCYMPGFLCSMDGFLLELNLPNAELVCDMPMPLLHRFPLLNRLNLMGNQITGNITELAGVASEMSALKYIDMSGVMLTGPLDTACGFAATDILQQLNLAQNALSGEIPACLMGISDLVELHLDQNLLQGAIPEIPATSPLVYFTASEQMGGFTGGGLMGTLPGSLPTLTRLSYLDLSGNMLTGPLPTALPSSLLEFRVSYNYLGGTIPLTFGSAQQLRTLELGNNQLYGTIPEELSNLGNIRLLDLQGNNLEGSLPQDWSGTPKIVYITLENNNLSGPLPGSLAAHPTLSMLDISNNQLTGDLNDFQAAVPSPSAEEPSSLWLLNLSNNSFSGSISDADGMANLGLFQAHTDPRFFQQYRSMSFLPRVLDLSSNDFEGTFPLWLVRQLAMTNESIMVDITGSVMTCPEHGFPLPEEPLPGTLDGLRCYAAVDPHTVDVLGTPMDNVSSLVFIVQHKSYSGFPTLLAVTIAITVLLLVISLLAFLVSCVRTHRKTANTKFQAFEDALPEGKSFDDDWDNSANVEMGKHAAKPKLAPLSSLPEPRQ